MRATPAIKKAPTAPRHPFQRKPSDAGRAKLTRTAIHVSILPADKPVFLEIGYVVVWLIVM